MTREELVALKLKYEGKLARLLENGSPYDETAEGVVEEISNRNESGWNTGRPDRHHRAWLKFVGHGGWWYFDRDADNPHYSDEVWTLELHPDQTGV